MRNKECERDDKDGCGVRDATDVCEWGGGARSWLFLVLSVVYGVGTM